MFSEASVSHSAHSGDGGVCLQRGLPPGGVCLQGGFASRGGLPPGGSAYRGVCIQEDCLWERSASRGVCLRRVCIQDGFAQLPSSGDI